ncbi:hypothetical protein ANCCAN_12365 [Ancylostoma caninum]|uniref:Uncharacterized protein n=1 Tax=Ancylostoma caninum TaxID=29170 RepID=A0A368GF95_ANCCA|nr:hypothetical protein ANCCAN_12365 [Ancylostoma caninum]
MNHLTSSTILYRVLTLTYTGTLFEAFLDVFCLFLVVVSKVKRAPFVKFVECGYGGAKIPVHIFPSLLCPPLVRSSQRVGNIESRMLWLMRSARNFDKCLKYHRDACCPVDYVILCN